MRPNLNGFRGNRGVSNGIAPLLLSPGNFTLNITSATLFIESLLKHNDANADYPTHLGGKDFIKALSNIRASAAVLPKAWSMEISDLMASSQTLLDISEIELSLLFEDVGIFWTYLLYCIDRLQKESSKDLVLYGIPLLKCLTSPDTDPEVIGRIAKRVSLYSSEFLNQAQLPQSEEKGGNNEAVIAKPESTSMMDSLNRRSSSF